jgi:hypothetical protein
VSLLGPAQHHKEFCCCFVLASPISRTNAGRKFEHSYWLVEVFPKLLRISPVSLDAWQFASLLHQPVACILFWTPVLQSFLQELGVSCVLGSGLGPFEVRNTLKIVVHFRLILFLIHPSPQRLLQHCHILEHFPSENQCKLSFSVLSGFKWNRFVFTQL